MKIYILLTVQVIVSFLTIISLPAVSVFASNSNNNDFIQPWISQVNYATFGKSSKCSDCNGYDKWVEIYNPNDKTIDLTGYKTQTGLNNSQKIQDKLIIAPHSVGYLVSNLPQNNNNLGVKATIGSIGSSDNGFKISLISPNGQTISQRSDNSLVQNGNVNTTAIYCSADSAPIASTTALKTYSSGQISMGSINQSPAQKPECKKETATLPALTAPAILNQPAPIITITETQIQPSVVITKPEAITQDVADQVVKNTLVDNKTEIVSKLNTETKTDLVPTTDLVAKKTKEQIITALIPNPIAEKQPDPKLTQISQKIIKTEVKPELKVESKTENPKNDLVKTTIPTPNPITVSTDQTIIKPIQNTTQVITQDILVETLVENKNPEIKTQIEPLAEPKTESKIERNEPKNEVIIDNQVKTQATVQNITEQNLVKTETQNKLTEAETKTTNTLPQTTIEPIVKAQETNIESKTIKVETTKDTTTLAQKAIIQESKIGNTPTETATTKEQILPTRIETPEIIQTQKIPATNLVVALPNRIKQIYLPNFNNQVKTQTRPTTITEFNLPITKQAQIVEIKSTEQIQIANLETNTQAQISNTQNTIQIENQPQLNSSPIVETQAQTPKVALESQVAQVIVNQVIEPKSQTAPIQESIVEQQFINQNSNLVFNQEQNGEQNTIVESNKSIQKPLTTWFQNQPSNVEQMTQNQWQSNKNQNNITSRKLQLEPMSTNWIIFGIGLIILSSIDNINKTAKNLMITNYSKTYSKR